MKHRVVPMVAILLLAAVMLTSCSSAGAPGIMPEPIASAASAVVNGNIYVFGGIAKTGYSTKVMALNSTNGRWSTLKVATPGKRAQGGAAVSGGLIYLVGGTDGSAAVGRVDVFDPATNAWSQGPALPIPVWNCMVAAVGQKVYVIGGALSASGQTAIVSLVQVLDVATGTWSMGPKLPYAVQAAAVAAVQDRIYVFGGRTGTGDESASAVARLMILDTVQGTWGEGAALGSGRAGLQAAVANGKVVVAGGSANSAPLNSVDCYDPASDTWTQIKPASASASGDAASQAVTLKSAVTGHCMDGVNDKVYVMGGTRSSAITGILDEVQVITVP